MNVKNLCRALALAGSFISLSAFAEPWLSTRYAQNCAGCHAPGRINVKPVERRCSLSCQGCHVNPNGGGLRSHYGKWNENRWLYSFKDTGLLKHAKSFEPVKGQIYGKKPWDKLTPKERERLNPLQKGVPLEVEDKMRMQEPLYDRRDKLEFVQADSWEQYFYQIPEDDPYRQMEESKVDAGGDIRWQARKVLSQETKPETLPKQPEWMSFLMSADFAVRWRPVYRNLHLVYESRIKGDPFAEKDVFARTSASATRSLYAMVDNLWYNVFVMGGVYRPLFGNYTADHTALNQRMLGAALGKRPYDINFKAVSLGTAPNVPYANFHLIDGNATDKGGHRGMATNLGLRFVTLGASINYSYWISEDRSDFTKPIKLEMHSMHSAARVGPTVLSLELFSIAKDQEQVGFQRGGVTAFESYTQMWAENYLVANLSYANRTPEIMPGSTVELKTGVRSFLIPGLELLLLLENHILKATSTAAQPKTEVSTRQLTMQAHTFF